MQTCVLRSNSRPCAKEFETQASSLGFRTGLFLCSLTLVAIFLFSSSAAAGLQSPSDVILEPPPDVILEPPPGVILEPPPGVILEPPPGVILEPPSGDHEISIRFVNGDGKESLLEPASGWPLTLSLTANEEKLLGIGTENMQVIYPMEEETAFLVFRDPDGCPSWTGLDWQENHVASYGTDDEPVYPGCVSPPPQTPWPMDETWVEVTPGLNLPDPDPEEHGYRPQLWTRRWVSESGEVETVLTEIGPPVGSSTDGFGYGPNPRLPGLVVIADTGPGIVPDADSGPLKPLEARNLAGFFHSVTCELRDRQERTSILAHMNVPETLFAPVFQLDACVGDPPDECSEPMILRVDGGPEERTEAWPSLSEHVVTLRAFVVNGEAPTALGDLDGNGVVDISDAKRARHRLLSAQAVLQVVQVDGRSFPYPLWLPYDFDGNGRTGGPILPDGPGALVDPPR